MFGTGNITIHAHENTIHFQYWSGVWCRECTKGPDPEQMMHDWIVSHGIPSHHYGGYYVTTTDLKHFYSDIYKNHGVDMTSIIGKLKTFCYLVELYHHCFMKLVYLSSYIIIVI